MKIYSLFLLVCCSFLSFSGYSQTLTIQPSGDNGVVHNNAFHILNNNNIIFNMSLSASSDSITKVDEFKYTYDGKSGDVLNALNKGKISIAGVSETSGSISGRKTFITTLKYYTGDYVSEKWKDDAVPHTLSGSTDVMVYDKPNYSFSGQLTQTVKGVADGLSWSVNTKGGNSEGWKVRWEYNNKQMDGSSYTLPRFENTTEQDQTLKIKVTITNYAPDNNTIWFSETKEITIVVLKAPAVETHSEIYAYSGHTITVAINVKNETSGWSVKWKFNGDQNSSQGTSFNLIMPKIYSDQASFNLDIEVLNTNSSIVVNSKQTIKVSVFSTGEVSFSSSVDSLLVNASSDVTLSVNTTGGMTSGWKFVWKDNGEILETSNSNSITFKAKNINNKATSHIYSVIVSNSIDGDYGYPETEFYYDNVQVYPQPSAPTLVFMRDENRGCNVSSYCIREGNLFSLWTEGNCAGGYYLDGSAPVWEKQWISQNYLSPDDPYFLTAYLTDLSQVQTMETTLYSAHFKNYGPSGNIWNDIVAPCNLKIYKRPQTPSSLEIKGTGVSRTLIATLSSLTDEALSLYQYYLVFGYEDENGIDHDSKPIKQEEGFARFDFMSSGLSNNATYVYALWIYSDAKVTSGKRYLDSRLNDEWDGSIFGNEPSTRSVVGWEGGTTNIKDIEISQETITIYDLIGRKIENVENLTPGIYIKEKIVNGERINTKFVVK